MFGERPNSSDTEHPLWARPITRNIGRVICVVLTLSLAVSSTIILSWHKDTDTVRRSEWGLGSISLVKGELDSWTNTKTSFCEYTSSTKSGGDWDGINYGEIYPLEGAIDIDALCQAITDLVTPAVAVTWSILTLTLLWALLSLYTALRKKWRLADRQRLVAILVVELLLSASILIATIIWVEKFKVIDELGIHTSPSAGVFLGFIGGILPFFSIAAIALDIFLAEGFDNLNEYVWSTQGPGIPAVVEYNNSYNPYPQTDNTSYVAPMNNLLRPGEARRPVMSPRTDQKYYNEAMPTYNNKHTVYGYGI